MMNHYILLRAALSLFNKTPSQLTALQLAQAQKQAEKEQELEQRVLNSQQAARVMIPEAEIQRAYQEVRGRYEVDDERFSALLADNWLTPDSLKEALARQLKVNTVLETIAVTITEPITDAEIELFYAHHQAKFTRPEQREVAHILISINADYPENSRENALKRAQELFVLLQQDSEQFAELALKHSECPTALQGGALGKVGQGRLYPELDAVLFELLENQISQVVESEMGFHLLHCKKIHPAYTLSLEEAQPKIRQALQERYQTQKQREWLASLPRSQIIKESVHV